MLFCVVKDARFCMVKGALLMCKRRPFATQKMPFYKPTCNQLKICRLQSGKSTVFFRFALHHGFKIVIYLLLFILGDVLHAHSPTNTLWIMCVYTKILHGLYGNLSCVTLWISCVLRWEIVCFTIKFRVICIGIHYALRFEYHVSYVRILCGFR